MFYANVYKFRSDKVYNGYVHDTYCFHTKKERDEFVRMKDNAKAVSAKEVRSYNFTFKATTLDGLIMLRSEFQLGYNLYPNFFIFFLDKILLL